MQPLPAQPGYHPGKNIVIGTHGTALSAILNYYRPEFGCEDFLRILDWMPYVVELTFEGKPCSKSGSLPIWKKIFEKNAKNT